MNFVKLNWLRRSLSSQLIILSVIFLLVALVYLIVVPLWSLVIESDPLSETRIYAMNEIRLVYEDDELSADLNLISKSEVLAEIAAVNPDFRYYLEIGDKKVQFGADPRWRYMTNFDYPATALIKKTDNCQLSGAFWGGTFDDNGTPAWVLYQECGGVKTYSEISGISSPIERATTILSAANLEIFWSQGRNMLLSALGVAIIAFLLLQVVRLSLRRLTVVADSFDEDSNTHSLPTEGLPQEVVPLVQTVNQVMHDLDIANEQQRFFLATAAHELRTPLAILRNRIEDLSNEKIRNELRSDIRRIASMVEQLLQLMHIRNRGKLKDEINLITVVKSVIADLAPLILDKGLKIEFDAKPQFLLLHGDENLIHVAITNLIDNAISFSKPGDMLKVRVDGQRRLTFRDQGPGISQDAIEKIFEPFTKIPPNRSGHGLGLAIVKAVVILHAGKVSARNIAGGGTEFTLQF